MEDPCHVHAAGEVLIDMCDRVRVAAKCSPGAKGELRLTLGGHRFRITVEAVSDD